MNTKNVLRGTIAALLTIGFTMAPATAFAGAVVYRDNYDSGLFCYDSGSNGNRVCFQQKGTWTQVSTPSGNVNYIFNGTSFISSGYAGVSSQTTVSSNEKLLFKAGMPHNGHSFTTTNVLNSYNGSCTAYTIEYDYAFANGDVKQYNYTSSETPC